METVRVPVSKPVLCTARTGSLTKTVTRNRKLGAEHFLRSYLVHLVQVLQVAYRFTQLFLVRPFFAR
jgi:hypothetical protein